MKECCFTQHWQCHYRDGANVCLTFVFGICEPRYFVGSCSQTKLKGSTYNSDHICKIEEFCINLIIFDNNSVNGGNFLSLSVR